MQFDKFTIKSQESIQRAQQLAMENGHIAKTRNQVFEILKKSVRPEFLNRIDELIMFKPLTKEDIRGIIDIQLRRLEKTLKKQDIRLTATDSCITYLQDKGFNVQFGARPLKRLIQKEIIDKISLALLRGDINQVNSDIIVDSDGKETFIKKG